MWATNSSDEPLTGQSCRKVLIEDDAYGLIEMLFTHPDNLAFLVFGLNHEGTKRTGCTSRAIDKRVNWQIN